MNTIKVLIIFIIFCFTSLKAQTQIDTTDYFPMQIGNYWEYRATTLSGYKYFGVTVKSDTLMPNGKKYTLFYEKELGINSDIYWYFRKDSNAVYMYTPDTRCNPHEYKYFDFNPAVKDSTIWEICRKNAAGNARGIEETFYDYRNYDWFQKPLESKRFWDVYIDSMQTIWGYTDASLPMEVSKGIGIVWQLRYTDGEYFLKGSIINGKKFGTITEVKEEQKFIPNSLKLQAYPNPFNNTVTLNVELNNSAFTELMIYNMLGQRVATIFEDYKPSGNFKFTFNADHLSSGVYFALLRQNNLISSEKIILLK